MGAVDDALIDRYIAGECSPAEAERIHRWMGHDAGRQERVRRARALWAVARSVNDQWDVGRAWERTRATLATLDDTQHIAPSRRDQPRAPLPPVWATRGSTRPDRTRFRISHWRLVAAACVVIGAGVLTFGWRRMVTERAAGATPESIATGLGQRVAVQLRDGSRVVLGPDSRLIEPVDFGARGREVLLNGAAYFDVVQDTSRPFVVVTRGLRIRDLGTKFVVDAYGDSPSRETSTSGPVASVATRVAVSAGAVQIEAIQSPRLAGRARPGPQPGLPASVVNAGHVARLDADGRITVSRSSDIDQFMSWTHGKLVFDDALVSEAIPRLERWYGTRILLGDSHLACRHITASFDNESLEQALDALSLVLHTRHVQSGRSITLEPDTRTAGTGAGTRASSAPDDCLPSTQR